MNKLRSKVGLDLAMTRTKSGSVDVPDDIVDSIVDRVGYSGLKKVIDNHSALKTGDDRPEAASVKQDTLGSSTSKIQVEYVTVSEQSLPTMTVIDIDPNLVVRVFKGNKRRQQNLKNIEELAESILPDGRNAEPVLLRPCSEGDGLEVIYGSRRLAAVKHAQTLTDKVITLRAIINPLNDATATREAALENANRMDFNPWDQADQLQELLTSGAVSRVEDLTAFLPTSNRKLDRTLVYFYLMPSKIPEYVRAFINEDEAVTNAQIKKLKVLLDKLLVNEQQLRNELAKDLLKRHQTVKELTRYLENKFFSDAPKIEPQKVNIKTEMGIEMSGTVEPGKRIILEIPSDLSLEDALALIKLLGTVDLN